MSPPDDTPRLQQVDWDRIERSRSLATPERITLLVGLLVVAALFLYHNFVAHVYLVGEWNVVIIDWVFMLAVVILVSYGVVPSLRRRERVARVFGQLRSKPGALFAMGYLALILVVGLVGPAVYTNPGLQFQHAHQPPPGFTAPMYTTPDAVTVKECAGPTTGDVFDRLCHGSLQFPLGTDDNGLPIQYLIGTGARVALYVIVISAVFVVPVATAVGVVAGLRGGLVDDLLMGYVDLQLSIPAMIVYLVANAYWHTSLLVLLGAFGLFSWGGIARLVRSEVLQRREAGHVRVARGFGAPWRYVARRHILPNVTNTIVPALFQLLALLVLIEAGLAFLGFHDVQLRSWGATISQDPAPRLLVWWVATFPGIALVLTILSLKLLGDDLRDALDPRGVR